MKRWLANLQTRERRMVLLGGAALLITVFYVLLFEPLLEARVNLRVRVEAQRDLLGFLQQSAVEVKTLRASGPALQSQLAQQSVLAVVDQISRSAGVKNQMKRLTPVNDKKVRLWFEGVPFDRLSAWLVELSSKSGLIIEDINVSPEDEAGLVRVNLTVLRPAA